MLWANAGRAPPHAVGWGSILLTLRQIGGTSNKSACTPRSNPVARGSRAFRSAEYWPTAHAARACRAERHWRCRVVGQCRVRSSPRRRPGLNCTNTATGRRHGVKHLLAVTFKSRGARPARISPRRVFSDNPRSTRRAVRTWSGCVVGQSRCSHLPTPSADTRPHRH